MATPRIALDGRLLADPFTVAQARDLDVARGRLRGADLEAPTRGVRRGAGAEVDLVAHARAFAVALPDDTAFSHTTAARLHRLPTPKSWPGPEEALDVMRASGRPRIERSGCRHHRGLEERSLAEASGLHLTSATDTWCDGAPRAATRHPSPLPRPVALRPHGRGAVRRGRGPRRARGRR